MRAEKIIGERGSERSKCREKFLRFFPRGFKDPKYIEWERGYKWDAHTQWKEQLGRDVFEALLKKHAYTEIAQRAVRIESRTNLLFSFEKMALRDAVKSFEGARAFAKGLHDLLFHFSSAGTRFEKWCRVIDGLPRKQTRVLTWPLVTVFGFIAQPQLHIFFKPNVTRRAATEYGFDLHYESRPSWRGYQNLLHFADQVRHDLKDLHARDMIDIQSFIWTLGSEEYDD